MGSKRLNKEGKWLLAQQLAGVAEQYGLDPEDFIRVAMHESKLQPSAVNKTGAAGVFQIMPDNARKAGFDPHDPIASAHYTAQAMKQMGVDGYRYYLRHNQGKRGAEAIEAVAAAPEGEEVMDRRQLRNIAYQPVIRSDYPGQEPRQVMQSLKRDYTSKELASTFMDKQRARFEAQRIPSKAQLKNIQEVQPLINQSAPETPPTKHAPPQEAIGGDKQYTSAISDKEVA